MGDSGFVSGNFGVWRDLFIVPLLATNDFNESSLGNDLKDNDLHDLSTTTDLGGIPSVRDDFSPFFVF